jgi:hypothetical protein
MASEKENKNAVMIIRGRIFGLLILSLLMAQMYIPGWSILHAG